MLQAHGVHCSFCQHLILWGVIHQTSWLESTGACDVQQDQAGGSSVQQRG